MPISLLTTWLTWFRTHAGPARRGTRPARRQTPWLELLEHRECPAAFGPNDVLVVEGNTLNEYTASGVLVQSFPVAYPGTRPTGETARGVVVSATGQASVFNGTLDPYLSTVDPTTTSWTHTTVAGWSLSSVNPGGQIGAYQQYLFAPNGSSAGGLDDGLIRFDSADGTATPFAAGTNYNNVTVGLDGKVYAVNGSTINVYDPLSLTLLRQVDLGSPYSPDGIAVDAVGNIFTADANGQIYEFSSSGSLSRDLAPQDGTLNTIAVSATGQVIAGQMYGDVIVTTEALSSFSLFSSNGDGAPSNVAFVQPFAATPAITSDSSAAFAVGSAGSFTVTTVGDPQPTLTETGKLPSGVSFNAATGLLSGTPASGTAGTYDLTFTAQNGASSKATQSFTLTVFPGQAFNQADMLVVSNNTLSEYTTGGTLVQSWPIPYPNGRPFTEGARGVVVSPSGDASIFNGTFEPYLSTVDPTTATWTQTTVSGWMTFNDSNDGEIGQYQQYVFAPELSGNSSDCGILRFDTSTGTVTQFARGSGYEAVTVGLDGNLYALQGNGIDVYNPTTLTFLRTIHLNADNDPDGIAVDAAGNIFDADFEGAIYEFDPNGNLLGGLQAHDGSLYTIAVAANGQVIAGQTGGDVIVTTEALVNFTLLHTNSGAGAAVAFVNPFETALAITSANSATFTQGAPGTFFVTALGSPAPTVTVTGSLPSGVTLNSTTGLLSGTPASGTAGTYPLTLTAQNGVGASVTQSFTLKVAPPATFNPSDVLVVQGNTLATYTTSGTLVQSLSIPFPNGRPSSESAHGVVVGPGGLAYVFNGTAVPYLSAVNPSDGVWTESAMAGWSLDNVSGVGQIAQYGQYVFAPDMNSASGPEVGIVRFDIATGTATRFADSTQVTDLTVGLNGLLYATNGSNIDIYDPSTLELLGSLALGNSYDPTGIAVDAQGNLFTADFDGTIYEFDATGKLLNSLAVGDGVLNTLDVAADGQIVAGQSSGDLIVTTEALGRATIIPTNTNRNSSFVAFADPGAVAAAFTSADSTTFTVGTTGSFTVTASGSPPPTITEAGTLPSGVTFASATGLLSGTPVSGAGGTYALQFTANNNVGVAARQDFTLTVDEAPALTSATNTLFTVGTASSFTVATNGFPEPALSESGSLPDGVTFIDNGNGTATLAGTPDAGSAGTYSLTFTAHNGFGSDATQSFTLTVGQSPAITSADSTTWLAGASGDFTVDSTGYPTPALSETGTLPAGASFTDNGDGTATLAGTPTAGGAYPFTLTAHNGIGDDATQSFTLLVDQPAAITSDEQTTFLVGSAGNFTVQTVGFPVPVLSVAGTLPAGVSFVDNGNGTATLAGTPAAGTQGTYTLTFTAHNEVGNDATENFTLTVNLPPSITSGDTATWIVGSAGSFTVAAQGDPTPALTETGLLPAGVTFVDDGDGTATLAGTPAADTQGTYPLTITAHNGAGNDATQSFTLLAGVAPAIVSADSTTFTTGSPGDFTVTTTGYPDAVVGVAGTLPAGVRFTDNGDGTASLSGTPAAGTGGVYSVIFTADNGVGSAATQSFTLDVDQPPVLTSAAAATFTTNSAGDFTITTTGFPLSALSESGVLPAGVSFTDDGDGTASLAGTPTTGSGGVYPLTITANNDVGAAATQDFTLTVDEPVRIVSLDQATFMVGTPGSFTVNTAGFPVASLSDGGATLPAGLTFTDNGDGTATLFGTPAADTGGTISLTLTAHNGIGTADATQDFTLVIDQAPSIDSSDTTAFTVGTAGSFNVTTTAGFPVATALQESGTLPAGVTFVDNGDGTATLAGTPQAGSAGTYALTVTADNGAAVATQQFTLTVGLQSQTISFGALSDQTYGNAAFALTASASSGLPITYQVVSGPATSAGAMVTITGAGTVTIAATQAGDGTYGPATPVEQTFTVDKAALIVTADDQSRVYGQAEPTLTATITGFVNGESLATSGVTGTPALTSTDTPTSSAGTYAIDVALGSLAANNYTFTTFSPGVLTVGAAQTTLTIVPTANPAIYGNGFLFTATISVVGPGAGSPSGSISLYEGNTMVGVGRITDGVAYSTILFPSVGSHTYTARYAGNADFSSAASAPYTETILLGSATTVVSSKIKAVYGQPVTFTATAKPTTGTGTLTGTITFMDGNTPLSTVPLTHGQASLTISTLPAGANGIGAVYNGSSTYISSTAEGVLEAVQAATTRVVLTSGATTAAFGQPVTLTARVVANAPSTLVPAGTVTFMDGHTALGSATIVNGVATLSGVALAVGEHALTAAYASANANDSGSTSAVVHERVVPATTQVVWSALPSPSIFGQSITLTVQVNVVAPGLASPGGTVTFKVGSTLLGQATVSNGMASISTVLVPVGNERVTAVYSGDSDTAASMGSARQVVEKAATTVSISVSPSPGAVDQPITLTAQLSVSAPGAAEPRGVVTFKDGKTVLGNATITNGVATLIVKRLASGTHDLTASYDGDVQCLGSTSAVWVETIA